MKRVDALGPTAGRQRGLPGTVLAEEEDPELQALVQRAASELHAPIALVSLVLDRVQFFRAHCGLPPDLARKRATRRDESFCQFVVRDETRLVVEDTANNPELPQQLIDDYGIKAYAGAPLRMDGEVLGTLCVIDTAPRPFTAAELESLEQLAQRATMRLREIAAREQSRALVQHAVEPAIAEMQNLLMPLTLGAEDARSEAFELELSLRVDAGDQARMDTLKEAAHRLRGTLDDVVAAATRISEQTQAMQQAVAHGPSVALPAMIEAALGLAHHVTRLSGGAKVEATLPDIHVDARATAVVATAISMMSSGSGCSLTIGAVPIEGGVIVKVDPCADCEAATGILRRLRLLAGPTVEIRGIDGRLEVVLDAIDESRER